MMEKIVDFHIHSKYSRACSPKLELPNIARACAEKGIDIVSTGDFTHPAWFKHLEDNLEEIESSGLYQLSSRAMPTGRQAERSVAEGSLHSSRDSVGMTKTKPTRFIFGAEVACIYKHLGKVRRLHLLIFAPNLRMAKKFNEELERRGVNLRSDGRPMMGLSAQEIVRICLQIDERMMVIPAHAWTPWFSVFGSKSGYDSLEECFEELTPNIFAIETGLSSDPPMNHRLSQLDTITLISNSDAHGLENLGREANALRFADEKSATYSEVRRILKEKDKKNFLYTIEFYPEEGKYHYDGHQSCGVCLPPAESKRQGLRCPKCRKPITVGVLHRVDELADRKESEIMAKKFIPHQYIVPLREIIASAFGVGKTSKKVMAEYNKLIGGLGNEFEILLRREIAAIAAASSDKNIALAIQNMRVGKVKVEPGYDGVFGKVAVLLAEGKFGPKQSRLF